MCFSLLLSCNVPALSIPSSLSILTSSILSYHCVMPLLPTPPKTAAHWIVGIVGGVTFGALACYVNKLYKAAIAEVESEMEMGSVHNPVEGVL